MDIGDSHLRHLCLEYAYQQLEKATDGFHESRKLGSGFVGTVYRGTMPDGLDVAIKVIDLAESAIGGFEDEVTILSKFRHPNLVVLMGWARDDTRRFLVYEFLEGGDVQHRLEKCRQSGGKPFSYLERVSVALDAATGLAHLHNMEPKGFHRDIKTPNILIGLAGAKMADFGLSCVAKSRHRAVKCDMPSGTPGYCCPNYLATGKVTEGSEIFSFGMVIFELLVNQMVSAMTPDGMLIYPIQDLLLPYAPNALQRCIQHADRSAEWPLHTATEVASLALACIGEESQRPRFNDVCWALRSIRDRRPPSQPSIPFGIGGVVGTAHQSLVPHPPAIGVPPPIAVRGQPQVSLGQVIVRAAPFALGHPSQSGFPKQVQPPNQMQSFHGRSSSVLFLNHRQASTHIAAQNNNYRMMQSSQPELRGIMVGPQSGNPFASNVFRPTKHTAYEHLSPLVAPDMAFQVKPSIELTPAMLAAFVGKPSHNTPAAPMRQDGPPSIREKQQECITRDQFQNRSISQQVAPESSTCSAGVTAQTWLAAGLELPIEAIFAQGVTISSLPNTSRLLPGSIEVSGDGQRTIRIGREFQQEWLESLVSMEYMSAISRAACSISWGPKNMEPQVSVDGNGPVLVDGVLRLKGTKARLQVGSTVTLAVTLDTGEILPVVVLVVYFDPNANLPALGSDQEGNLSQAAPMADVLLERGVSIDIHPSAIESAPTDRWQLECIRAPIPSDELVRLPRTLILNLGRESLPATCGQAYQTEMFDALLAGDSSLGEMSRTHIVVAPAPNEDFGTKVSIKNHGQNDVLIDGQFALGQQQGAFLWSGQTLSFTKRTEGGYVCCLVFRLQALPPSQQFENKRLEFAHEENLEEDLTVESSKANVCMPTVGMVSSAVSTKPHTSQANDEAQIASVAPVAASAKPHALEGVSLQTTEDTAKSTLASTDASVENLQRSTSESPLQKANDNAMVSEAQSSVIDDVAGKHGQDITLRNEVRVESASDQEIIQDAMQSSRAEVRPSIADPAVATPTVLCIEKPKDLKAVAKDSDGIEKHGITSKSKGGICRCVYSFLFMQLKSAS